MIIGASGRAALLLAAGLWVACAGTSQAAAGADTASAAAQPAAAAAAPIALAAYTKRASHHRKNYAHRKSGKADQKSAASTESTAPRDAGEPGNAAKDSDVKTSSAMPPWVANAKAQILSPDATADGANLVLAQAGIAPPSAPAVSDSPQPGSEAQLVASDQLNDIDRALPENPASAPNLAMMKAEAAAPSVPAIAATVKASFAENRTWEQTSLIGKIFIGFGALLTMASAVRMFMA